MRILRVGTGVVVMVLMVLMVACGGDDSSTSPGDPSPVPAEFTDLHAELAELLTRRENELRADWDGVRAPVIHAVALLTASSNNGANLLDPAFRAGNSLTLSRLVELGVQGFVLQINYPILTAGFTSDASAYLLAYREIADEIRALGRKVIVEHNVLLPGFSTLDPVSYYATLTRSRFGQESYVEVRDIVEQIHPDYLSLVTEPGTFESVLELRMSVADWTAYVAGTVNQLAIDVPDRTTKIGAGSGTWESVDYVTSFSSVSGLDFIDLHAYPVTNSFTDYLQLLDTWPVTIRSLNPSLEIISSESWLYKAQASELGGAPISSEFFARDAYSFWGPLDSQFLDILAISAHKNDYAVIAPFWSNYLSAYLDYDDPTLSGLTPEEILDRAFAAAFQAIQSGQSSDLGQHFKAISGGSGP